MHTLIIFAALAAASLFAGCATTQEQAAVDRLPADDRAAVTRCQTYIERTTCSRGDPTLRITLGERAAQAACFRDFVFRYAQSPRSARPRMLMRAGCPPHVVE